MLFSIGPAVTTFVRGSSFNVETASASQAFEFDLGECPPGPYWLITQGQPPGSPQGLPGMPPPLPSIPIWIRASSAETVDAAYRVSQAISQQEEYRNRPIGEKSNSNAKSYKIYFVLEGCRLDYSQPIEGGYVYSMGFGTGVESHSAIINKVLTGVTFPIGEATCQIYEQAHPIIVVAFNDIRAEGPDEAVRIVRGRVDLICGVLALDRSSAPKPIAVIRMSPLGQLDVAFFVSPYYGNMLSGFVAGQVTESLDRFVRAAEIDPWIGLVLGMYVDAIAEKNNLFRVVKLWSLLESCAKRRDWPGFPKKDSKGFYSLKLGRLFGKDLAKVCHYLCSEIGFSDNNFSSKVGFIDIVTCCYRVRNVGAHEGVIDPQGHAPETQEALRFVFEEGGLRILTNWAEAALRKEQVRALGGTA